MQESSQRCPLPLPSALAQKGLRKKYKAGEEKKENVKGDCKAQFQS